MGGDGHEKRFHGGAERLRSAIVSVLDAGTVTGIFAEAFAGKGMQVMGIDSNEELLKVARAAVPGVEFREALLEQLPFGERSFDLVDPLAALGEARRVARVRVAILEWPYRNEQQGPPLHHRLPAS